MKPEMRQKLAQLPFEDKIRKVGELIWLSRNVKGQRVQETDEPYAQSQKFTRPGRRGDRGGPKNSKK